MRPTAVAVPARERAGAPDVLRRTRSTLAVGLLVAAIGAVLPVAALLLAGQWASTEVTARTLAGIQSTAQAVAAQAGQSYGTSVALLANTAGRQPVAQALAGDAQPAAGNSLRSVLATGPFTSIGLYDASGRPLVAVGTGAPLPDLAAATSPGPVQGPVGGVGPQPLQAVTVPVRVGGRLTGFVTGTIDLHLLFADTSQLRFGATGKSLLVALNGRVIVHPDPASVGILLKSPENLKLASEHRPATVTLYSTGLKKRVVEAYAPVVGQPWGILSSQITDEAFAGAHRLNHRLQALAGLFGALGLLLAAAVATMLRARDRRIHTQTAALATAMEMFTSAFEDAPTGVALVALDGRFLRVNPALCRLTGYSAGQLLTLSLTDITHPDDGQLDPAGEYELISGRLDGLAVERRHLRADGESVWVAVDVSVVTDGGGRPLHYISHITDITARRAAAAAMSEANRQLALARDAAVAATQAKSAFLATMSHEIRTPMNAVIGMTGLLLDTDLDPVQLDFAETVRDSGEALLSLINDILDFSKIESGQLELEVEPFELRDCVESALALLAVAADTKGLELVADLDAGCPDLVVGDATRLRQVLVNLVGNAVKFTPDGEVVVSVRGGPERLTVAVRDTGIGIPAERMDRLFQAFSQIDSSTTRQYGGTGLGLVISRRLVHAMGGELTATSRPGAGSTFTFSVTLARSPRQPERVVPAALAGRSALVVDDNAASRAALRQHLQRCGLRCTDLGTAAAALELVRAGHHFDVALLDLHMPETGGAELAQSLRGLPAAADLPLVLLSDLQTRLPTEQEGLFVAVLSKPVKTLLLEATLLAAVAGTPTGLVPPPAPLPQAAAAPPEAPLRILLAEDNLVNQKVAQLMLARLGHRVDTVSNGHEAVAAVRRTRYDLVLMDVQMPELDGLAATQQIRAELPVDRQPTIAAMTASVLVEDRSACSAAGMDDYVAKPVRMEELDGLLTRCARSRGARVPRSRLPPAQPIVVPGG